MAVGAVPVSDPTLLADIRKYGKFDPTGCYQCGSCTLSCDLVEKDTTFPRRSIRFALLGLRQPLLASLDPWVCHDCGDCSTVCPRQSEPRISMITLRRFLSARYEWVGIGRKLLQSTAWYLGSLIAVALLTLVAIIGYHLWYVAMPARDFATTPFGLDHMFPMMTYYTLAVILFPMLLLVSRVAHIWRLTMRGDGRSHIPWSAYFTEAWVYVYESIAQTRMRKCPEHRRWFGHEVLAVGTLIMINIKVWGLRWFQTDNIYPIYNPQRWVGYIASALMLYGIAYIMVGRWRAKKEIYKETHFQDLVFPVLLVLTILTGLAAHVLRYCGVALACHYAYAMHIVVATPMLVIEMSFGKWSHMVYRPLALYFLAVKDRATQHAPAGEAVPNAI
ncbi:MAG: 4Fe-4S dicluster domain-containing protein [Terriglobales bacterium]|jgi:ferredoxin